MNTKISPHFLFIAFMLSCNFTYTAETPNQEDIPKGEMSQQEIPAKINHGWVSDFLLKRLQVWNDNNSDQLEEKYYQRIENKFKTQIDYAKRPEFEPVCKITWTYPDGSLLGHGTGVLIAHPQSPEKKCILTVAHVAEIKNAICTVTFAKDPTPRRMIGVPFYPDKKGDSYGIDIAVFDLESYPENISPAPRSSTRLALGDEIITRTIGYGDFYTHFSDEYPYAYLSDNQKLCHAVFGIHHMGNNTSGLHKTLFEIARKSNQLEPLDKVGTDYLLSLHIGKTTLEDPITKIIYPAAPGTSGSSGAPLFNPVNEIIGIHSHYYHFPIGTSTPLYIYYPLLSNLLFSPYRKISNWTGGFILGEKSHHTTNIIGGIMMSFYSHKWCTIPRGRFPIKSLMGSIATLSLWKLTNTCGNVLERFSKGYTPLKIVRNNPYFTLAIPVEPYNEKIDSYLENGTKNESLYK